MKHTPYMIIHTLLFICRKIPTSYIQYTVLGVTLSLSQQSAVLTSSPLRAVGLEITRGRPPVGDPDPSSSLALVTKLLPPVVN